jgi:hypothetical protein
MFHASLKTTFRKLYTIRHEDICIICVKILEKDERLACANDQLTEELKEKKTVMKQFQENYKGKGNESDANGRRITQQQQDLPLLAGRVRYHFRSQFAVPGPGAERPVPHLASAFQGRRS